MLTTRVRPISALEAEAWDHSDFPFEKAGPCFVPSLKEHLRVSLVESWLVLNLKQVRPLRLKPTASHSFDFAHHPYCANR